MKNSIKYLALLFIVTSFTIFSCCKTNECEGVVCTKEFRSVTVKINQVSLPPVFHPISLKVYKPNGQFWKEVTEHFENNFSILNDAEMSQIDKSGTYKVEVIKNNIVIAIENYELSKDCCHVQKISGKAEISI